MGGEGRLDGAGSQEQWTCDERTPASPVKVDDAMVVEQQCTIILTPPSNDVLCMCRRLVTASAARDVACGRFKDAAACLDAAPAHLLCGWAMASGGIGYDQGCHSVAMAEWTAFAVQRLERHGDVAAAAAALGSAGRLTCPGSLAARASACSGIYRKCCLQPSLGTTCTCTTHAWEWPPSASSRLSSCCPRRCARSHGPAWRLGAAAVLCWRRGLCVPQAHQQLHQHV